MATRKLIFRFTAMETGIFNELVTGLLGLASGSKTINSYLLTMTAIQRLILPFIAMEHGIFCEAVMVLPPFLLGLRRIFPCQPNMTLMVAPILQSSAHQTASGIC